MKAGSITKGIYLVWNNEPVLVVDKEFFNPGKGAAVVRLKLKNVKTGNVVKQVLRTDEPVQEIFVENKKAQFMYQDQENFVFVDPKTFEQLEVSAKLIGEDKYYMLPEETYRITIYNDEPVGVVLPLKMIFEIVETESGAKGDTVTSAMKDAVLQTGLEVKVPLFIKKGERIIVSTQTGEYVARADKGDS